MAYRRLRSRRPRRVMRRRGRNMRRMRRFTKALHGVKKFVSTYKYTDIFSDISGANVGGWARDSVDIVFSQTPLYPVLSKLYCQFAITGVKLEYRPTNTSPDNTNQATQWVYAENKGNYFPVYETITQLLSEDNSRRLTTSKAWKTYVKFPRPALMQLGPDGTTPVFAAPAAKAITWLNMNSTGAVSLPHLVGNYAIEDQYKQVGGSIKQGELWVKVYVACKEQMIQSTTPNIDLSGNIIGVPESPYTLKV